MKIYEFYFDQDSKSLYIEFSTKKDGEKFYRRLDIPYTDVEYYSPTIISEQDMDELDEDFINEFLEEYFKENDLPPEETL